MTRLRMLLVLAAIGLGSGCQTGGDPATAPARPTAVLGEASETLATVEAVDLDQRLLTVRDAEGELFTVQADETIRNLPQVRPGDRVVMTYREAVAVQLQPPGTPVRAGEALQRVTRAPAGARPGAEAANEVTTTVRIENVDPAGPTVSFTDQEGFLHMVTPQTPEMQAFARTLRKGDQVEVTFTEAVALEIRPAG